MEAVKARWQLGRSVAVDLLQLTIEERIHMCHLRNNMFILAVNRRNTNIEASYRPVRFPKSTKNGAAATKTSPDPKMNLQRAHPSLNLTKRRRRK